jgi:hypothetical protein
LFLYRKVLFAPINAVPETFKYYHPLNISLVQIYFII